MSSKTEQERRYIKFDEVRVTQDTDGNKKIEGYAAVFDKLSEDLGYFREKIKRGAFKRTLEEGADVRALIDHDSSKILGRNVAGTLTLKEDKTGLLTKITPPDTSYARDLLTSIGRGDIDGMSFGFTVRSDKWNMEEGKDIRTLLDVDLFDVSVVTYPAYPDTSVALRSKEKANEDEKKDEDVKTCVAEQNELLIKEIESRT